MSPAPIDELFVAVSRHEALQRIGLPSNPPALNERYELHRVVGSGGFGVVYQARDTILDSWVALKRTRSDGLGEARALAAIRHPNVVRVFDVFAHGDAAVLVMEYLDGVKLTDWVRNAQPSTVDALALLARVADGLGAIHKARLVHADIKPSNVVVVGDEPIIVDLGLAWTRGGGTPKYMAPELANGQQPDAASDQYSLCLLATELLGSRAPWRCARALRRGLSLAPQERWPGVADLAAVLHSCTRWRGRWSGR